MGSPLFCMSVSPSFSTKSPRSRLMNPAFTPLDADKVLSSRERVLGWGSK